MEPKMKKFKRRRRCVDQYVIYNAKVMIITKWLLEAYI